MPTKTVYLNGIDVHTAVRTALQFFKRTFTATDFENVQLEEIEKSKDGKAWMITIGYEDPRLRKSVLGMDGYSVVTRRSMASQLRQYKVVHVDAHTGEPVAVKIRG